MSAALGARVRIVLLAPAGSQQEQQRQEDETKNEHGRQCSAKFGGFGPVAMPWLSAGTRGRDNAP
ncbi:hypothetical protein, partial [Methanothrix soehngenii]|uniref:hypothetical protein n=1 Tax=Methanothrix soehngenii TaxID=2223 RepID=UPI00300D963A